MNVVTLTYIHVRVTPQPPQKRDYSSPLASFSKLEYKHLFRFFLVGLAVSISLKTARPSLQKRTYFRFSSFALKPRKTTQKSIGETLKPLSHAIVPSALNSVLQFHQREGMASFFPFLFPTGKLRQVNVGC